MKENWQRALNFNLRWEGGWAERPNEPGGAVNRGVSLLAYKEWCKKHGRPEPTKEDLHSISDDDVSAFYKERADQIGFDYLDPGYDLALFNASTMQGVGGAKKLHEQAQGDIGKLIILHMQLKMKDPNVGWHINPVTGRQERYGPGWSDRLVACYEVAKELASGQKTVSTTMDAGSSKKGGA